MNLNNNDNDLDIYLKNKLKDNMDELNTYLQERLSVRAINKILSLFYLLVLLLYFLIGFKPIYK